MLTATFPVPDRCVCVADVPRETAATENTGTAQGIGVNAQPYTIVSAIAVYTFADKLQVNLQHARPRTSRASRT
jgi:hypothetical protein